MASKLLFAATLAAGLTFAIPALAEQASASVAADPVLAGIGAMPGGVEDVRIGGTFEKSGKSGAYRIVIARSGGETVTARLFVQWVDYDDQGGATVDTTIEIKEIAEK